MTKDESARESLYDKAEREMRERYKKDLWHDKHERGETISIEIGGKKEIVSELKELLMKGGDFAEFVRKYPESASEAEKILIETSKGKVDARSPIAEGHGQDGKRHSFTVFMDMV